MHIFMSTKIFNMRTDLPQFYSIEFLRKNEFFSLKETTKYKKPVIVKIATVAYFNNYS